MKEYGYTVAGCCVGVWKNESRTVKQSFPSLIGFDREVFYCLFLSFNLTSFVIVQFDWMTELISSSVLIEEEGTETWTFDVAYSGKKAAE